MSAGVSRPLATAALMKAGTSYVPAPTAPTCGGRLSENAGADNITVDPAVPGTVTTRSVISVTLCIRA